MILYTLSAERRPLSPIFCPLPSVICPLSYHGLLLSLLIDYEKYI